MKKRVLVSLPLLLAACTSAPTSSPDLSSQSVLPGRGVTLSGTLDAGRHQETESSAKHLWTISKTPVNDGQPGTAVFTVQAKRISISTIAIKSETTTVQSSDLKVCHTGLGSVTLTALSATLTGLDGSGTALPTTLDLGDLFGPLPQTLAGGACLSTTFTVSSADPGLSAQQQTMLNTAAQFSLALSVTTTASSTSVSTHQTPAVTPAFTTHNTAFVTGDATVTLADPGFISQGLALPASISGDTTVQVSRVLSCADRAGLQLVPGTANLYRVPNTATLSGPSTNLSASSEDTVTLNCTEPPKPDGCTFTQGYYKTHAQYRSAADAQRQALNRQYDPAAWKGARDWNGSQTRLLVGGVPYTQGALVQLYLTPPKGHQALALFHQLVTAKLNLLKQSDPALPTDSVQQVITAAEAFFAANPSWPAGQYVGNPAQWMDALSDFNEGLLNGHC